MKLALNQIFSQRSFSSYMTRQSPLIKTAGCIIIGDEVLNSKITDTNSRLFGRFCFQNGIQLSKVSIIGDEPDEIISTVREFDSKYDLIVTSGGIGPTHDDVTYESIARAFSLPLKLDDEARSKMYATYKHLTDKFSEEQTAANLRMVTLPYDPKNRIVKYLYAPDLWVPIVNINDKLNILPGIPRLFENMLMNGIYKDIENRLDPESQFVSYYVTTKRRESALAPFLKNLSEQVKVKKEDVKLGSYPHQSLNSVSITGRKRDKELLRELVNECVEELDGTEITREEEEALSQKSYDVNSKSMKP